MKILKYRNIVFDLDGTLTESGIGITRSVAYAYERLGLPVPEQAILDRFVGPPLVAAFMEYAGQDEAGARNAAEIYRERFSTVGWRENRVYTGIAPLLRALKAGGASLSIASGKPEIFVRRIIEYFGIAACFDRVVGISMESTDADKVALITSSLPENFRPEETCMVGDRRFDMEAARAMGIAAIGAGYGYGSVAELKTAGATEIAATVDELWPILLENAPRPRGLFISFEGADGCGKSTQMQLAADYLSERGWDIVTSREPGGCDVSERIRSVVLDAPSVKMSDECEALLFAAARAEHVKSVILPALALGKIVLCDRYLDSSIAYQAYGRELGEGFIRQINVTAEKAVPDRTLLFVGNRETVSRRLRSGAGLDRIEVEKDSFVKRVYSAYEHIRAAEPARVHQIESNRTIEEIFVDVRRELDALIAVRAQTRPGIRN